MFAFHLLSRNNHASEYKVWLLLCKYLIMVFAVFNNHK